MINKKNVLGKAPEDLGEKDAIHVAIVSVRAARPIMPGQRCKLNENREAEPSDKGVGVADPFRRKPILRGQNVWLILDQTEIPNVQHVWEHPKVDFTAPTTPPSLNQTVKATADLFGVTYAQIMEDAQKAVDQDTSVPYPSTGTKTPEELAALINAIEEGEADFERYDFWSEWKEEALHEFYNNGSECCPEYDYPSHCIYLAPDSE